MEAAPHQRTMGTDVSEIPVEITGNHRKEPATVKLERWSPRQRKIRGLKSLGLWWGLAVLSVAIPILHFLLVPLFFALGLVLPFVAMRRQSIVLGGKGTCPYCSKPFTIARQPDRWPLQDICTACNRHVTIFKQGER